MPSYKICPSILSANFAILGQEIESVIDAGADTIHFDVMDNHYVPNLTFGPSVCQALRQHQITAPIDVHLMVKPVDNLIEMFVLAGANHISIHPESTEHLDRSLNLIIDQGLTAGLAFNPSTPLHYLDYTKDKIQTVLIMMVNPGFGGQKLQTHLLSKITEAKQRAPHANIQVDGGVTASNIQVLANAGADSFVASTAIFGKKNYKEAIDSLRLALTKT